MITLAGRNSVLHLGLDLGVRVRRVLRELDHDGVLVHDRDVARRHEVGLAGLCANRRVSRVLGDAIEQASRRWRAGGEAREI